MTQTVTAIKARQNLGELLNRVALRQDEFIIKRGRRPMAVVIPIEKFERLQAAARVLLSGTLQRAHRGGPLAERAADALADEAKHSSRRSKRRAV